MCATLMRPVVMMVMTCSMLCWGAQAGATMGAQVRLEPEDLEYLGAFVFPAGDEWTYSGHALAFRSDGDPAGPADGYPGSLYAAAHAQQDLVGEMTIPVPVISNDLASLPVATVLQAPADVTGGLLAATCAACATCDCDAWDVSGLEYLDDRDGLGGVDRIVWNIHDWYNVGGEDLCSLGWSLPDMSAPAGVWHIGPRPNTTYPQVFHNGKTSDYLLLAPESFADANLGSRRLIAGYHRESGSPGGSQGPTFYATAPWTDGTPPSPGQDLDALALVYYPWVLACTNNDFSQCAFPGYRVDDDWGGAAWVEAGGRHGLIVFGLKGLGDNCYGDPGVECPSPACDPYRGWHSDPYQPQALLYDPAELAEVVAGTREPWEALPYATLDLTPWVIDPACAHLLGVAYDAADRLIYVAESSAGDGGETAVHVWRVLGPIFSDGFESGDTTLWSAATAK